MLFRSTDISVEKLTSELKTVLELANRDLMAYGKNNNIRLGTTASVILFWSEQYICLHIGDSRIYHYSNDLKQITEDDNIAAEKAKGYYNSGKADISGDGKNILTRCIGINPVINPHIYFGDYKLGDIFFLCCDGMYGKLDNNEISSTMLERRFGNTSQLEPMLESLIEKVISRGERDNITGIIVGII